MIGISAHNINEAVARHGEGFSILRLICKDGSDINIHLPIAQAQAMAMAFNESKDARK